MALEQLSVSPADGVGAYIGNIDLSAALKSPDLPSRISLLTQALGQYGVLFFQQQSLTPQEHILLAEAFGTININRFFTAHERFPKIAEVRKEPTQDKNIGSLWHTDHSYDEEPAMGSILVAQITPASGGDTVFSNMYLAYEHLSDGLKKVLCGLNAVHSSRHVFGASSSSPDDQYKSRLQNAEAATQDSIHPMVISHPISGKPALYVNPTFTVGIEGWHSSESKPLLEMLYQHAVRPEFTHRFKWQEGSIAFWDNRATWHCALNDYPTETRLMHRITLEGEAVGPAVLTS